MRFFNSRHSCLCAFCGHQRKVYHLKQANLWHFVIGILLSIAAMWAIWQRIEPRGILIFFLVHIVCEVIVHFRWRLSLVCRQCGFDPLVYLKNKDRAAQKVKEFLDRRRQDPRFLLAPALNLPKQVKAVSPMTSKSRELVQNSRKGRIVSKTI